MDFNNKKTLLGGFAVVATGIAGALGIKKITEKNKIKNSLIYDSEDSANESKTKIYEIANNIEKDIKRIHQAKAEKIAKAEKAGTDEKDVFCLSDITGIILKYKKDCEEASIKFKYSISENYNGSFDIVYTLNDNLFDLTIK